MKQKAVMSINIDIYVRLFMLCHGFSKAAWKAQKDEVESTSGEKTQRICSQATWNIILIRADANAMAFVFSFVVKAMNVSAFKGVCSN